MWCFLYFFNAGEESLSVEMGGNGVFRSFRFYGEFLKVFYS
jgi:hypothetical protein